MLTDLRTAVRGLRAAPGFTAVALLILTLGIGASTAIFSVVDAVVLRGLPFDESDRLVWVGQRAGADQRLQGSDAPQNFLDWRAGQQVFDGFAAVTGASGYILRSGTEGHDIRTTRVTSDLFTVLRVPPMIGRGFSTDEEVEGRHRVAVLSHGFWQRQFGGDPAILGRTLPLDNGTYEVVGVMPPSFTYPLGRTEPTEMWVPYVVPASERVRGDSRSFYLQLVARLKPGVSVEQAEASMVQLTQPIASQFPTWFKDRQSAVVPLHEALVGRMRPWMRLLVGAVAFVLLLACINLANLMLARSTTREREVGIRAALGASRWRLARALLVESLLLSVTGAVLGLFVAWAGVDLLRAAMPASVPRLADIAVNLRVLAVAAGAAVGTGILFGSLPAWQNSRPELTRALKDGGRSSTAGISRQRVRAALVIGEVALAVVLLVGSGLFLSSFFRVMAIDTGLNTARVITLPVPLGSLQGMSDMSEAERSALALRNRQTLESALSHVRAVPGVEHAAIMSGALPLTGSSNTTSARLPGAEPTSNDGVEIKRVTAEYHAVMGVPLAAGRLFTAADRDGSAAVVILNDLAAQRLFLDESPIGRIVDVNGARTVVGVVGHVRQGGPESDPRPEVYVPLSQVTVFNGTLVVRTASDPHALLPAIEVAITAAVPNAVFPTAQTLDQLLDALTAQRRFNMLLFSLFGVLGLVIALVGVYGVMRYLVEQRTMEFGIRMALGAARRSILLMVLRPPATLMVVGVGVGVGTAVAMSRLVATFLFEVQPGDAVVYGTAAGLLAVSGLLAALIPAWKASRVDPIIALRSQG